MYQVFKAGNISIQTCWRSEHQGRPPRRTASLPCREALICRKPLPCQESINPKLLADDFPLQDHNIGPRVRHLSLNCAKQRQAIADKFVAAAAVCARAAAPLPRGSQDP